MVKSFWHQVEKKPKQDNFSSQKKVKSKQWQIGSKLLITFSVFFLKIQIVAIFGFLEHKIEW